VTLSEIKAALRNGPYAWPGGYPLYFVTSDGGALSFEAVRDNWREIASAHIRRDETCGWHIAGYEINWEDSDLLCDHTGERIESAYAEPEEAA
jgi:hypothetical protein